MKSSNIAIFVSGKGSNAETLMRYFSTHKTIGVQLVLTNNKEAEVIEIAEKFGVFVVVCSNDDIASGDSLIALLKQHTIHFIVLAGFLRKIPPALIDAFPSRIINIHPSLLPKFGGKGMYGDNVHKAVLEAKEKLTGITIHTIDERYDHGMQLAQFDVALAENDSLDSVRAKVKVLEHKYFASTIEEYINNLASS